MNGSKDRQPEITDKQLSEKRRAAIDRRDSATLAWRKAPELEKEADGHRANYTALQTFLNKHTGMLRKALLNKIELEKQQESKTRKEAERIKKFALNQQQRAVRVAYRLTQQAETLRDRASLTRDPAEGEHLRRQASVLDEIAALNRWELGSRQKQNLPRISVEGHERSTRNSHRRSRGQN